MTPTTTPAPSRREQLKARQQAETQRDKRRRTWTRIVGAAVTLIVAAVVGYGLWTAIPEQGDTQRLAPDFTLTTTAGTSVTLSDLRPNPVLIYFNEGAGLRLLHHADGRDREEPRIRRGGHRGAAHRHEQRRPDPARHAAVRRHHPLSPRRRHRVQGLRRPRQGHAPRACPDTASSSSTATASNAGTATTPPCGSTRKNSSTRSPRASGEVTGWDVSFGPSAPRRLQLTGTA